MNHLNIQWKKKMVKPLTMTPFLKFGFLAEIVTATLQVPMTYVNKDASSGSGDDVNMLDGHKPQAGLPSSSGSGQKRGRKATGGAIVDAMLEIAAASKMRASAIMKSEDRFSISKCIKVLDETQDVDERIYFLALDLFEVHHEVFISVKGEKILPWLQSKCGVSSSRIVGENIFFFYIFVKNSLIRLYVSRLQGN